MFYLLAFIALNILVARSRNPYLQDPFCYGRLVEWGSEGRRFELSANCDLEPLAKPFKSFPPSVFIIGAQKAGTSAVVKLLRWNTVLETGLQKEIRYLSVRTDYFKSAGTQNQMKKNYEVLMSNSSGPTIDGSPGYHIWGGIFVANLKYATGLNMHSFPKMVFVLRDPLTRLYSHYNMRVRQSTLKWHKLYKKKVPSFEELIYSDLAMLRYCGIDVNLTDPNFDPRTLYKKRLMWCFHNPKIPKKDFFLVKGMYSWQLEMLRRSANPNRIIVTCFDDLVAENKGFLKMLTKFIGLDTIRTRKSKRFILPSHKRIAECPMNYRKYHNLLEVTPLLEKKLHIFYNVWNKVLQEDFGIDCGWRRELTC